jgi:hypothetical protein
MKIITSLHQFMILFGILCLFQSQVLHAQDKFKFGEVPVSQLEMTVYEKDSTASALVLYENQDVYYSYKINDFEIVTEYTVRIKILTQEGVEYANGSISLYQGRTRELSEDVSGLTGFTYNLENGEIVKEKLSKNYIFTEDISERNKRLKFALPAVKVGSVIEYKYRINSPYYYNPQNVRFQRSIPVQYSYFDIKIPEYFIFNKEVRGYEHIKVEEKPVNGNFIINGNMYNYNAQEITAEVRDLPALKDEDFVWNYGDFMSGINFEIKRVQIVGVYYKDYTQTWNSIVKLLNESENFSKKFNNKSLFKDELPLALASKSNAADSIRAILDLVRSKVKWNNKSTLFADNPSKAIKEGTGSSGEINALLIAALRNAGFTVNPIALSLRSRGRIPITYPSINNLNYFIVCVNINGDTYFLDGTMNYTDINVIPIDCLTDRALCIFSDGFDWIDLTSKCTNVNRSMLNLKFNEEGILSGEIIESYNGEIAYVFKRDYNKAKDEAEYIETLETKNDIRIHDYKINERREGNYNFTESYKFEKNDVQLGEDVVLSLNPLLFEAMKSNAFKSETRKLPVEFPFPYEERVNISLTIPEGYALDEAPKPEKIVYDEWAEFSYIIQQSGNLIQIATRFKLNTCVIPVNFYTNLRDFWSKMYAKNNEFITLKKL